MIARKSPGKMKRTSCQVGAKLSLTFRQEIAVRQELGKALIEIEGSGKLLPADMDIFESFVTENTARTAGQGTGLGLAITKLIIQRHGGEIYTEALDGAYTKAFVVRLKSL